VFEDRLVIRMNATQCRVWDLAPDGGEGLDDLAGATEITDGHALLSLVGTQLEPLMERLCRLDIFAPEVSPPRLFQGSLLDLSCQMVRFGGVGGEEAILIALPRGYGQSAADAILKTGCDLGLDPAGEIRFKEWLQKLHSA